MAASAAHHGKCSLTACCSGRAASGAPLNANIWRNEDQYMLFKINPTTDALENVVSDWTPPELKLEKYLVTRTDSDVTAMSDSVFGEPLLLVSNQVRTSAKKRADMLALDRAGNGVIIELKRNEGRLGVETQALQYLADFSNYRGRQFLQKFSRNPGVSEETARSLLEAMPTLRNLIHVAVSF